MAEVLLPNLLGKYTNGRLEYRIEGETVSEVLEKLSEKEPLIKDKLFKESGQLRAFFCIYLNGKDIRMLQNGATKVKKDSQIKLFVALAGG